MDEQLISKKMLLELTGITYGQLYRWKRKNLIPEDWFEKKSSYTGQETFFPKEKILERVAKILDLKDEKSLDELADTFSPVPNKIEITRQDLIRLKGINEEVLELYTDLLGEVLTFAELLGIILCQEQLEAGTLTTEEGSRLILFLKKQLKSMPEKAMVVHYLRKLGTGMWVLTEEQSIWIVEDDVKRVLTLPLRDPIEKIKLMF